MCMYVCIAHILPLMHDVYPGQGYMVPLTNEHGAIHFKAPKYGHIYSVKPKHPSTWLKHMVSFSDYIEKIIKLLYTLLCFF